MSFLVVWGKSSHFSEKSKSDRSIDRCCIRKKVTQQDVLLPSSDDTREATPTSWGTRTGGEASGQERDGMAGAAGEPSAKHAAEADEVVCFRLPPELWQKIVDENLHQNDLLAFAMTCRLFRDTTKVLRKKMETNLKAKRLLKLQESGKMTSHTFGWFQWVCDTLDIQAGHEFKDWSKDWFKDRVKGAVYEGVLLNHAAFQGSVEILRWLMEEKGCKLTLATGEWAATGGSIEVLEYLRRRKGYEFDVMACHGAARVGHLGALKYLRGLDPPCPWDEQTCFWAANGGHLEVLQWLRGQDPPCPWDRSTCSEAAKGGQLEALKWARSEDPPCPWDRSTCSKAAYGGQLEVLKWLRDQDPPCPWDWETCVWAAEGGQLEALKWLRSQDPPCPWSRSACLEGAWMSDQQHIFEWINQQEDESDAE